MRFTGFICVVWALAFGYFYSGFYLRLSPECESPYGDLRDSGITHFLINRNLPTANALNQPDLLFNQPRRRKGREVRKEKTIVINRRIYDRNSRRISNL